MFVATGVSAALQLSLARVLMPQWGITSTRAARDMGGLFDSRLLASGPYGLIFASMVRAYLCLDHHGMYFVFTLD